MSQGAPANLRDLVYAFSHTPPPVGQRQTYDLTKGIWKDYRVAVTYDGQIYKTVVSKGGYSGEASDAVFAKSARDAQDICNEASSHPQQQEGV